MLMHLADDGAWVRFFCVAQVVGCDVGSRKSGKQGEKSEETSRPDVELAFSFTRLGHENARKI